MLDSSSRLALDDTEINLLIKLEPRRGFVARVCRNVGIRKLRDPRFFIRDQTAIDNASLTDTEVLVVVLGEGIVEVSIGVGEGGSGTGVDIHADDIDVVCAGPPALYIARGGLVGGPEHQDLGVVGNSSMDILPCRNKLGLRCIDC